MIDIPIGLVPWVLGVLGAFIGSFLNVCIYRMPAHRSIVYPGSACPSCGAPVRAWQNIPVLSWIALRGRCASCAAPIAARYPFIEALTSAIFVVSWFWFGPGWELARALILMPMLIVLFFTDLDERILPDLITFPGIAAGLGLAFFRPSVWPFTNREGLVQALLSLAFAAAAAAGAAATLWLVGRAWLLLRPELESAMGLGDVKMLGMIGAFLGGRLTLLTVLIGSVSGTLLFLLVRLVAPLLPEPPASEPGDDAGTSGRVTGGPAATGGTGDTGGPGDTDTAGPVRRLLESTGFLVAGRGAGLLDQIPFGCLLAIGAAVACFAGDRIIAAYIGLVLPTRAGLPLVPGQGG